MKIEYIILLLVFFSGCTCVPDITAPRDIAPEEFSNINIINAVADESRLSFSSRYLESFASIDFGRASAYIKLASSTANFIRIANADSSIIYNSPFYSEDNLYYTMVFYGSNDRTKCMLLRDDTEAMIKSNCYIRIINAFDGGDSLFITSNNNLPINDTVATETGGKIITTFSGALELTVKNKNSQVLTIINGTQLENGHFYQIVLYPLPGSVSGAGNFIIRSAVNN